MSLPSPAAQRLRVMQGLAARGVDAAKAGEQSGLFTKLESRLIRAALNAGSPGATYARLAEHYAQRHRQWSAIRSRLMLPAFVLFTALVVQPLPGLVSGSLGMAGYAWQALSPLLLIAALVSVLAWLGTAFPKRMPLYAPIFVRSNLRDFFESLGLMHEAGVPLLEALPAAIDTVSDGDIRRELTRVRQRVEQGTPFATALEGVSFLRGSPVLAFAHTGQESGTLPEMLMRHAAIETDAIGHFHEQAAIWLPRVVYVLVAIKVVAGIFSTGIGPRVPKDL